MTFAALAAAQEILPIDLTALLAVFMGISVVLIPVLGITARFALKPTVEALSRFFDRKDNDDAVSILERRMALLEQQLESIESSESGGGGCGGNPRAILVEEPANGTAHSSKHPLGTLHHLLRSPDQPVRHRVTLSRFSAFCRSMEDLEMRTAPGFNWTERLLDVRHRGWQAG